MKGKESPQVDFATFVSKSLLYLSIENENACNKVVIGLIGMNFKSNSRCGLLEIKRMISDLIIYITKLLDSDWLTAVQCFCKHSAKRVNFVQK